MISKITGSMPLNTMNRVNKLKSVAPKSDITLPNNAPKRINLIDQFKEIIAEIFPTFDPDYNKMMKKLIKLSNKRWINKSTFLFQIFHSFFEVFTVIFSI